MSINHEAEKYDLIIKNEQSVTCCYTKLRKNLKNWQKMFM